MRLTGFPDLLGFNQRNRTVTALKERLDIVSREAVTGLQADVTKATNGLSGQAHLVFKGLEDLEQSSRLSALAKTRLDMTNGAISGARNAMNGISTRAIVALEGGGETGIDIITQDSEANLRSAMAAFGAQQGSRNLLSGAATGGFQTNIYQGADTDAPPLNIGNGKTVEMGVRGDTKAIRDSLRGMAVIATASEAPLGEDGFRQVFLGGAASAANGETGLIETEGQLGILSETLAKSQERQAFEKISLSTAYQNLVGRDQFEAAAELKQLEVALESSYVITSRLSGLSLVNYLR